MTCQNSDDKNSGTVKRPCKWIAKELSSLDPYTDYEKIFRISTSYGGNDFINSLIYALIFPNFIVTEHGARVVWRNDGGKVLNTATARVEHTELANDTWWYYGPSNIRTQKSVEAINRLHARWAKQYPGAFSHNEDYIYTLAFSAIFMHRLRLRMGLSGFSEKVKIASHIFMGEMVPLFRAEGGVELTGWPQDWDGLITFCEEYESKGGKGSHRGHLIANAIYDHFAFRWFTPSLRWLGRAIPISLTTPRTLAANKIERPNVVLRIFIVSLFGWLIWIMETFGPDPQHVFLQDYENMSKEDLAIRKQDHKNLDNAFAAHFVSEYQNPGAGCPYRTDPKLWASGLDLTA
ncbi:hypothetical protein VTL71DRAFT_13182 [Oculimacula yallundae]|uniref:ER-bound oxygenase mpaB/mpaB'/Rubber oxygenase catalytic domain-containing protein n=1 Tax=Oculimacula yallundae TaxID=86028 RepID=A0ABR4CLR1_9HELO